MHIDKYTFRLEFNNEKQIIYNLRTGAQDILRGETLKEFSKLTRLRSFAPQQTDLSGDVLNYLVQRGYISVYSPSEAYTEACLDLETARKKILFSEIEAALLIRPTAAQAFCPFNPVLSSVDSSEFDNLNIDVWEKLISNLIKYGITYRIGIYLTVQDVMNRKSWFNLFLKKISHPSVKQISLYLVSDSKKNTSLFLEHFSEFAAIKNITILDLKENKRYYFGNQEIENKPPIYPFLCPFFYRTLFVAKEGSIDYCPIIAERGDGLGTVFPEYKVRENWRKEWFITCCEKNKIFCKFYFVCMKKCPALSFTLSNNLNNIKNPFSCVVGDKLEKVLKETLLLAIGEGKEE